MHDKLISDVLSETAKIKTKVDKLRINFDDDIVSLLPKGAPPYKKDDMPAGHNHSDLHKKYRQFAYFFKGKYTDMNQIKREGLYIQMLEAIHPSEAEVLIAAINKDLSYKGLTKKLVMDTFPNLIRQ